MYSAQFALLHAAQTADLELLDSAIQNGVDIHALREWDRHQPSRWPPVEVGVAALHAALRFTENKELTASHIEIIERLLALGVSANKKLFPNGGNLLHTAVLSGHAELVRLLLERGAVIIVEGKECVDLIEQTADKGMTWLMGLLLERLAITTCEETVTRGLETALCKAAQSGHSGIVEMLLDFGVGVDSRDVSAIGTGDTALMHAATRGQEECVDLLRSRGADTWAQGDRGMNVLIAATRGNLNSLAFELLQDGADPNTSNFYGITPLHHTASQGNDELVRALIAHGANLRAKDNGSNTILHAAASGGLIWLIEACLQAGETVDVENAWGYTPLMSAARSGHRAVMDFLVRQGAQINHVAHYQGETALHYAIYGEQLAAVQWLVEYGADLNAEMADIRFGNLTPLMNAVVSCQPEIAKMLLEAGAEANAVESEMGLTASHYAARVGQLEVLELLLLNGADVDARDSENGTPFMAAALNDNTQVAERLISAGAEVNARDQFGNTSLHNAVRYHRPELVELLLRHGADRGAKNERGETPLMLADDIRHPRIMKALSG